MTPDAVIARDGAFTRPTQVLARDKVQSVLLEQGPLLKLNGLAVVHVRVAGGSAVELPEIGEDLAKEVFFQLCASSAHADQQPHPYEITQHAQ